MEEDSIMQELRAARRELLKNAGGDLGKLLEQAHREAPRLLAAARRAAKAAGRGLHGKKQNPRHPPQMRALRSPTGKMIGK